MSTGSKSRDEASWRPGTGSQILVIESGWIPREGAEWGWLTETFTRLDVCLPFSSSPRGVVHHSVNDFNNNALVLVLVGRSRLNSICPGSHTGILLTCIGKGVQSTPLASLEEAGGKATQLTGPHPSTIATPRSDIYRWLPNTQNWAMQQLQSELRNINENEILAK